MAQPQSIDSMIRVSRAKIHARFLLCVRSPKNFWHALIGTIEQSWRWPPLRHRPARAITAERVGEDGQTHPTTANELQANHISNEHTVASLTITLAKAIAIYRSDEPLNSENGRKTSKKLENPIFCLFCSRFSSLCPFFYCPLFWAFLLPFSEGNFGLPRKSGCAICNSLILCLFALACVCSCLRLLACLRVLGPLSDHQRASNLHCLRLRASDSVRQRL